MATDDLNDDETSLAEVPAPSSLINRGDIEAQLDAAHRYPRSIKKFLAEAITLVTLNDDVAKSCIYGLPRGGKIITGPGVRLAELAVSAYRNIHAAARVVGVEDTVVVSQGVTWDLEKNVRVTVEARRRITKKSGDRFDDDMITVTGNAAASVALRNAIFRVIPRAYIDQVYAAARKVAVGDAETLTARRDAGMAHFAKLGVPAERVLARVGKPSVEDIGLEELEQLIGVATAIKNGDLKVDDAFPSPAAASTAQTKDLEAKLRAQKPKDSKEMKGDKKAKGASNEVAKAEESPVLCMTCGLAIPANIAPVSTSNKDGEMGVRHPDCKSASEP